MLTCNQSIASGLKDTSKPRFDEGVARGAAVKAGCPRHRRNARKNYVNSRYARNGGVRLEESTPSTRRPPPYIGRCGKIKALLANPQTRTDATRGITPSTPPSDTCDASKAPSPNSP